MGCDSSSCRCAKKPSYVIAQLNRYGLNQHGYFVNCLPNLDTRLVKSVMPTGMTASWTNDDSKAKHCTDIESGPIAESLQADGVKNIYIIRYQPKDLS